MIFLWFSYDSWLLLLSQTLANLNINDRICRSGPKRPKPSQTWIFRNCALSRITNPPAPLWRGTKAARLFSRVFLSISSHCYSASSPCFYVFRGLKNLQIALTRSRMWDLGFRQKSLRFQACFQGLKNQKNSSQSPSKTLKIHSGSLSKRFSRKVDFRNTFHAKTMILKSHMSTI